MHRSDQLTPNRRSRVRDPQLSLLTNGRLQLLALGFSTSRSTDSDTAIVGDWADEAMWEIGRRADRDG
jgi:hypothetical protein